MAAASGRLFVAPSRLDERVAPWGGSPTTRADDRTGAPWPRRGEQQAWPNSGGSQPRRVGEPAGGAEATLARLAGARGTRVATERMNHSRAAAPCGDDSSSSPAEGRAEPPAPSHLTNDGRRSSGPLSPLFSASCQRHPLHPRRNPLQGAGLVPQIGDQGQITAPEAVSRAHDAAAGACVIARRGHRWSRQLLRTPASCLSGRRACPGKWPNRTAHDDLGGTLREALDLLCSRGMMDVRKHGHLLGRRCCTCLCPPAQCAPSCPSVPCIRPLAACRRDRKPRLGKKAPQEKTRPVMASE